MIDQSNLWGAQDALLKALEKEADLDVGGAGEVALGLGFPADIEREHVWIGGDAEGELEADLTGRRPSEETFRMHLFVFAQAADYETARSRIQTLGAACESALASEGFAAVVPSWRIPQYRVDAGTDGSNSQLCLELIVECRCW